MILLAIDPGKVAGLAMFSDRVLTWVGIIDMTRDPFVHRERMVKCNQAIVEMPVVYPGSKTRPRDLISVAYHAGIVVGMLGSKIVETVAPLVWKGQRPKSVDNAFTLRCLTAKEKDVVNDSKIAPSKINHVLDAVGLGLWKNERR